MLKRILPNLVAMNPLTAVSFVLAGGSLLLGREGGGRGARGIAAGLALLVCLVGLVKLLQVAFGWEGGIDQALFPRALEAEAATTGLPNRMAPNTALNFFLLGAALLVLDRQTRRGHWPAHWLALISTAASSLAVIGYLFGTAALYGVSAYIPMALHTALTFILVSLGVLCARPRRGLAALVVSDSAGGLIARRLLPAAVVIPLVLGWLRLEGQRAGLYGTELGVALIAVASMVVFTAVVWLSARSLHDADLERGEAEERLREAEARFRSSFRDAAIGMAIAGTDGRWLQADRALCEIVGYSEAELLEMTFEDVTGNVMDEPKERLPEEGSSTPPAPNAAEPGLGDSLAERPGRPARVLIADDHALVREGLRAVLEGEEGMEVVGEAEDGEQAVSRCAELGPDVVLMDVRMPRVDGLEATRRVKARMPGVSVVMVTMHENPDYLLEAVRAGAAGYVLKDASGERIAEADRRTLAGDSPLEQGLAMRLLERLAIGEGAGSGSAAWFGGLEGDAAPAPPRELPDGITPREAEVLGLMTRGLTNPQIGAELGISRGTAKVHVQNIIAKLGVSDRTQAAVRAVELGLFEPGG